MYANKPQAKCTRPPSTSHSECSKTASEQTTKCCEQWAKQRAKSKEQKLAGHASSSTGGRSQPKVTPMKQSSTRT
uniref:Uncharacterized protein n=1 Tax=Romanomermis culicivorax TaxID=13658 RepID=A0A915IC63_ROMCU